MWLNKAIVNLTRTLKGVRCLIRLIAPMAQAEFLARKNYAKPERVGVEIGMQTQTFAIFPSNETAIILSAVSLLSKTH